MTFTWTWQPCRPNYDARWLGTADGGLTAEASQAMPGGRWMTTVRREGKQVGFHRMNDTDEEGKAAAEREVGPSV